MFCVDVERDFLFATAQSLPPRAALGQARPFINNVGETDRFPGSPTLDHRSHMFGFFINRDHPIDWSSRHTVPKVANSSFLGNYTVCKHVVDNVLAPVKQISLSIPPVHRSIDVGPLARETIPIGMNATRGLIERVEGDVVARIPSTVEKIRLAVTPVYGRVEMRPRLGHTRPVAPNRAFTLVDLVLENVEA